MDPIVSDIDWLLVIPAAALPPGIGTISVNLHGVYVEPMEGDGRQVSWPEIADWILHTEASA